MKKYNNTARPINGFTLVELLIFMGLFSIILMVMTTFFSAIVEQQVEVQTISAVQSDTTYILSRLRYDMARAEDIITPAVEGESGSQLILLINGFNHTYALNGATLELTNPSGTQRLNNPRTTVSGLLFQRIGNTGGKPTIHTTMTITSIAETSAGPESTTIDTTFAIK